MPLLQWSDYFSIKIKEMDEQHKKIISMLNSLVDLGRDKSLSAVGIIIDQLVKYTKDHFLKEEDLMKKHEYPELSAHKLLHTNLIQTVDNLKKKHSAGDPELVVDLSILLNDWLAEHILVEDKKYGVHINKQCKT